MKGEDRVGLAFGIFSFGVIAIMIIIEIVSWILKHWLMLLSIAVVLAVLVGLYFYFERQIWEFFNAVYYWVKNLLLRFKFTLILKWQSIQGKVSRIIQKKRDDFHIRQQLRVYQKAATTSLTQEELDTELLRLKAKKAIDAMELTQEHHQKTQQLQYLFHQIEVIRHSLLSEADKNKRYQSLMNDINRLI